MPIRPAQLFRRLKADVAEMLRTLAGNALLCRICFFAVFFLLFFAKTGYISFPCPFYDVFHRPCPGCGMTRSFQALFRLDGWSMLKSHPFTPYFLTFGLFCLPGAVLGNEHRQRWATALANGESRTGIHTVILILFVCYGILRVMGIVPFLT